MALVEVYAGFWVRPELVTAVIAFDAHSLFVTKTSPQVKVYAGAADLAGWEFKTWDAAQVFADKIAAAVNAALPPPPYPQLQAPSMWYPQSGEARSNMQPLTNAQNAQQTRTDPIAS